MINKEKQLVKGNSNQNKIDFGMKQLIMELIFQSFNLDFRILIMIMVFHLFMNKLNEY